MTNIPVTPSCTRAVGRGGGRDTSPACAANALQVTAAEADTASGDPCCRGPHQGLRLMSLLPSLYVMPKGKRAARKAGAFDKPKDWSVLP